MNRRIFLKRSCGGILLSTLPVLSTSCYREKKVRFGVVTDLHYAGRETGGTRYYQQSLEKLHMAIDLFTRSELDFIIELGDFKDQDIQPERETTLTYLDQIESVFQSFQGPAYHVLGNHDMDSISKKDFFHHTSNYQQNGEKGYYSFISGGVKCIVLDANFRKDGADYEDSNFDWTEAFIPEEEKEWLREELAGHSYPVVIFIHQLLDYFSGIEKELYVHNADEILPILEENKNVLAVFQGHHHPGNYSFRNGIHYWTMKALIEGSLPENNSYAIVEIDPELNISIEGYGNCEYLDLPHSRWYQR